MDVNLPEVFVEVSAEFARYERALAANDLEALDRFFWRDPRVLRYSIGATQHGHQAIAASRRARTTKDLERIVAAHVSYPAMI